MKKLILFLILANACIINASSQAAQILNLKDIFDISSALKSTPEYQRCAAHYSNNLDLKKADYKAICQRAAINDLLSMFHNNSF